jgi:fibronectin type 3 domain-containing protein
MKKLILASLFSILFGGLVHGAEVKLSWNANQESDLAGYKMYWGNVSRTYSTNIDVGNQTMFTVPNLAEGKKYYFACTAYDTSNNESDYSNEVSVTIADVTPPGAPTNVTVIVVVQ